MSTDSLGDRMKRYEAVPRISLMRRSCVILRVDGRAFHTFTRGMDRPFDQYLADAMVHAAASTAMEMQGFQMGYHQSDEVSFFLHDFDRLETDAWFGNDLQKMVSITTSLFTGHFIDHIPEDLKAPAFDCRAFTLPHAEVANYFLWRARDWHRNSLFIYARTFFSDQELHGKGREELHEMLHAIGKNWTTDVDEMFRNGTFFRRVREGDADLKQTCHNVLPSFAAINEYLNDVCKVWDSSP